MKKETTIYDVAKMAGVSVSTVSRVLNMPTSVNPATRRRIVETIEELHFVPKASASVLARQQYHQIGVIAPLFSRPSMFQRLRGLTSALAKAHYEILLYNVDGGDDLDGYIDKLVAGRRADALVCLSLVPDARTLEKLRRSGLPVCFVEASVDGFDCVVADNEKAGRVAAEYLYERGYRRPCFVGESAQYSFAVPTSEQRYKGFRDYFSGRGIELPADSVWLGPYSEEVIDKQGMSLFASPERPDCMVGSGDMVALRLVKLVLGKGGRIPGRLAVLGFGNLDVSEYFSLSTVEQYLEESGRLAAELVIDRLKAPERIPRQILMPLTVIERGTVRELSLDESQ